MNKKTILLLLFVLAPFALGAAPVYDLGGSITGAATGLVTNIEPLFKPVGDTIFAALTVVMIVVCGKKIIFATSTADYHSGLNYTKSFVGHWLVGWTCLAFYDTPLWGGMSIHQVLPMIGAYLANKINLSIVDITMSDIGTVLSKMPTPSLFAPAELMAYGFVLLQAIVMEAVLVLASSFSFVAIGVGTLFGPILISGIIVPWLRHLFFGWFSFSLKFSMFSVAAAGQAFIWATAVDSFFVNFIAGDYSLVHLLKSALGLGVLTIGAVLGLLSTGSLVNDLFGGTAHGSGSVGVIGAIKGLF